MARLDTMVTVVDATTLLPLVRSAPSLAELELGVSDEDERTLGTLLVDQVEFADVIVINKTDLASTQTVETVEAAIRSLNPGARVLRVARGAVPLAEVLDTGRFDMAAAEARPACVQELEGERTPETEAYGVPSFVYRARHPFHPARLHAWLHAPWPGVLRAKGWFWVATRPNQCASFQLAGATRETGVAGAWWASVPAASRPRDASFEA